MIIWFNHQPTLSYHVPQCHIYPFLEHPEMVTSALPWVTLSEKKFFLISNNLHWHNLKPLPLSPMMYLASFRGVRKMNNKESNIFKFDTEKMEAVLMGCLDLC